MRVEIPVRALGSTGDLQNDDEPLRFVDQVDDPKVPDPESPEVRGGQLPRARWARLDGEGKDRAPEPGRVTGWQAAELPLRGGRDLHSVAAVGHAPSGP